MMMAKDSTPPHPELDPASIEMLRSALREFVAQGRDGPGTSLRAALTGIASEAREKRMHAEQLLVLLKDVWYELHDISARGDVEAQSRMLQRVVTLCIREYYSGTD